VLQLHTSGACLYRELMKRETFDSYLSSALGIKQREESGKIKRLIDIDESCYVLTLDYTMKVAIAHKYSISVQETMCDVRNCIFQHKKLIEHTLVRASCIQS